MIRTLAIAGYRSMRDLRIGLQPLNVVTGANGSGKSNLYRALHLLAETAQGRVIQSLAAEGGLTSTLWAGPERISAGMKSGAVPIQGTRRHNAVSLKLGFASEDYGYAIDLGLPAPIPPSAFDRDPEIKSEQVWIGETAVRSSLLAERHNQSVRVRSENGAWRDSFSNQESFDSMMTHYADPRDNLELLMLRERMRGWRFYDHLRTDRHAPARAPQIGTRTPVLAGDGSDLAAAAQTILEIGDDRALAETIDDAFPGAAIGIEERDGYFELVMQQHGLLRSLKAAELSDGTLRFLLLACALLSPRPPELMVLNEPEGSLHPSLLAPLARLISRASERSQIVAVSHAEPLISALIGEGANVIRLEKRLGETVVDGDEAPPWTWPSRR